MSAIAAERLLRAEVDRLVATALDEDLALGPDVTTLATIDVEARGTADVVARAAGVVAGVAPATAAVELLVARTGAHVETRVEHGDGERVAPGDTVLTLTGSLRLILTVERTLLNLLSQLSGVATATSVWVAAVAGAECGIRDTRKTVPGMRMLQKAAVVAGGGVNHRLALGDAALVKDNHVAAAGSVAAAFLAVRNAAPQIAVEVECDTLEHVREALDAGADLLLLDNMSIGQLRDAVALATQHRAAGGTVLLEASGGITLADASAVAATGVDLLAVGALTHSAPVLDLGLDLRTPHGRA